MLALTLFAALMTSQTPADAPTVAGDAAFDRPIESMTRAELKAEYEVVAEKRPGIGAPITLMAIGGGSIAYGALLLLTTGGGSQFTSSNPVGYLFVAMIMAGAAMLFPGIWLMWSRRQERSDLGERLDAISERLNQLDRADDYAREHRERETPEPARALPPGTYPPQL